MWHILFVERKEGNLRHGILAEQRLRAQFLSIPLTGKMPVERINRGMFKIYPHLDPTADRMNQSPEWARALVPYSFPDESDVQQGRGWSWDPQVSQEGGKKGWV